MRPVLRSALIPLLALFAAPLVAQEPGYQHIVINEVAPIAQTDHAVELYNYGPDQLLNSWSLTVKTTANATPVTYTFPAAPNLMLKRHALVTLHWSAGSNTQTDLYLGSWPGGFSVDGEAVLKDNGGKGIDYVRWGNVTPSLLPTDLSWPAGASFTWASSNCSIYRNRDTQTRQPSDWTNDCLGGPSTFGQLAKNQVGTRRYSPVMINEIDRTGMPTTPPKVELFNPNPFTVTLSGWKVRGFNGVTPCETVTLSTPTNIAAGGYLTAAFLTNACNWSGTNIGSVALFDPSSTGTQQWDSVSFNGAGQPQFNPNNFLIRKTDIQSGSVTDWGSNITGSTNAANPGQLGGTHVYDELGGIESPARTATTGAPGGIGQRIRITRAITLREIKFRANLANGVQMQAAVYQLTQPSPELWSLVGVTLPMSNSIATEQVYSTGALNPGVRLSSPGEYAVMVFANGSMTVQETLVAESFSPGLASGVIVRPSWPAPTGGGLSFGATDTTVAMHMQMLSDLTVAVNPEVSTVDKEAGASLSPAFTSPGTGLAWSQTGALPASVTFQVATATLVGTPGDADVGSYPNIKIRATDGNGTFDENSYTLQIHPRLAWVTSTLRAGEVGVTYYPPGETLAASGGPPGGYSWSLFSGTLPPGLILDTAQGRVSGTPTTPGTYGPFTLRVTDALGVTADRSFSITVYPALSILTTLLPAGSQGVGYNQTLNATGGDAGSRSWSIVSGALPPGFSLSAAGQITGTAGSTGVFNFTVRVQDATGGQTTQGLTLTINGPLAIVTPSLPDGEDGFPYSQGLIATGGDGVYTWTDRSGLPAFCTLSSAGLLECTSPLPGAVALTVRVTDGTAAFVEKLFNFTFVEQPIIVAPVPDMAIAEEGVAYSQPFTVSGGLPPFNWSAGGLPSGLSMSAAGTVSGTPGVSGTFGVGVRVDDGIGGYSERTYANFQVVQHVSISTLSLPMGEVGALYTGALSGELGQAPYAFSLVTGALPPGISLSSSGGLSGTPGAAGNYTPTFRITDALGGIMDRMVPIDIAPELALLPPSPPAAEQGVPYSHFFMVSPGTGLPPFTFALTPYTPAGMSFSPSTGELSGAPTTPGGHNLTIQVTDALGVVKASGFTLTIAQPVSITTPLTLPMAEEGVYYSHTFTAVDGVAPYNWTHTLGTLPNGLSFTPATGTISGTPTGTGGTFSLRVTDAAGGVADKTFLLNIAPPVQITTSGPLPFGEATVAYNNGNGVQMTAMDGIPPYNWSISLGALPAGLSMSGGGLISGTPTVSGLFGFTARVQDAAGGAHTRAYILTINPAPQIINTSLPKGVVQVNYPAINLIVENGQAPYSFAIITGTLPAGVTFNGANGQFGGKPTQKESQTLQFRVTDALGATHTRSLTIQVIDPPLPEDWSRRANFSGGVGQIVLPKNYNGVTLPVAYAAADGGGELFRSVDRGLSWQPFLIDPSNAGAPIHTLKLTPDFNYAGAVFSGEIYVSTGAGGVYRSSDGGATFSEQNFGLPGAATLEGPKTSALAIHPDYPANKTVWVAMVDGTTTKLYSSNRGGANESWNLVASFPVGASNGVAQLEASPNYATDNTLFAVYDGKLYRSTNGGVSFIQIINPSGMNERIRRVVVAPTLAGPVGVFAESNLQFLYRSLDGGDSFIIEGIPGHDFSVCGTGTSRSLYVKLPPGGGEYALAKSQDFGKTWIPVYARGMRPNGEVFGSSLAAGGVGPCDLYSGTQAGMTVSTDDGNIFFPRQTGIATIKANSVAGRGNFVVAGIDGGFLRSKDGGQTFIQTQNVIVDDNSVIKLPNVTLVAVSPSYNDDKVFFISLISNFGSQISSLYRTTDGGYTFKRVLYQNVNSIAFRPGFNGDTGPVMTMYAGTNTGVLVSTDGGLNFLAMTGVSSLQCNASTRKETDGFSLSPRGMLPPRLYRSGDSGICYSDNEGANWTMMLGGGGAPFIGTISTPPTDVTSSTGEDRMLLRTDFITHQIYYSTDNGVSWNCVLTPSATCMSGIVYARAFFSPNYSVDRTALIAVNRSFGAPAGIYRFDAVSHQAYPLTNYGTADQLRGRVITGIYMTPGFNGGNTTNSVALVTTEGGGLYRSTDGGRSFLPVSRYDYASANVRGMMRAEGGAVGFTGDSKARLNFVGPQTPAATSSGTLVAASDDGVFASDDGGITFDDISSGLPEANVMATWVPSSANTTALAGIEGQGLWVYNGSTWSQDATYNSGTFVNFTEDDDYLYAVRANGTSLRGSKTGTGWTALGDAGSDLQMVSSADAAAFGGSGGADKLAGPRMPAGTTASLWSVSLASGPKYSTNSGGTWTTSAGGNDYTLPSGASGSYKVVAAMGLNTVTGAREAVVGYNGGVYRTTDGGDTWKNVSGTGSGLEATTKNATAILTSTTAQGGVDVLVGISGTSSNGGVYLSGDGGEHWTQINSGFDASTLSISTLVKTSCSGCPVQYYTGSYGGGMYTRTVTVNAPPFYSTAATMCVGSTSCTCTSDTAQWTGSINGGEAFKICGSNFATGAVVEFDGVAATSCTASGGSSPNFTTITCTGTPAHAAGTARVRVRNTDTRVGYLATSFTYTGSDPTSRAGESMKVTKSGDDITISYTCASCTGTYPARVHRAQNSALTTYPEIYNGGASGTQTSCTAQGGHTSCYGQAGLAASSNTRSYFWKVE